MKCNNCGKEFEYDKYFGVCPNCGDYNKKLDSDLAFQTMEEAKFDYAKNSKNASVEYDELDDEPEPRELKRLYRTRAACVVLGLILVITASYGVIKSKALDKKIAKNTTESLEKVIDTEAVSMNEPFSIYEEDGVNMEVLEAEVVCQAGEYEKFEPDDKLIAVKIHIPGTDGIDYSNRLEEDVLGDIYLYMPDKKICREEVDEYSLKGYRTTMDDGRYMPSGFRYDITYGEDVQGWLYFTAPADAKEYHLLVEIRNPGNRKLIKEYEIPLVVEDNLNNAEETVE